MVHSRNIVSLAVVSFLAICAAQFADADVTSGLFSRYSFEVDGRDDAGSNEGTLVGGASVVSDPERGNVLLLDGNDDYVALPPNNMASGKNEITLTMWVCPDEWSSGRMVYDEAGGLVGEWWQFSMSCDWWYTRDSSTGSQGSRDNDVAMPTVPAGQWHHLAFVYSVSGENKAIYYDGAPHSSSSVSVDQLTTDRDGVGIGYTGDVRNLRFDGKIDEVRFYDRALSPAEIDELASMTNYTLTVNSGSGDGDYAVGVVVNISADAAPSGLGFSQWTGDVAEVANVNAPNTAITMPSANVVITATYGPAQTLTVNSGSGGGQFGAGAVVPVVADDAAVGYAFDRWMGDTGVLADAYDPSTMVTMPAHDAEITATYQVHVGPHLTVNSGSGGGGYDPGTVVSVSADAAPSGMEFNMWIGDLAGFDTVEAKTSSSATYTMPDASAVITATYIPAGTPKNWYPAFDVFCKAMFGATKEELVYDTFGQTLALEDTGEWNYASKNSATVAFQTNLPAVSYIEYGTTTSYGSETTISDRYLYTHIFHLTGLDESTTYHYRLVAEDELGNVLTSPGRTLATGTPPGVIYIPGGLAGPPYELDQAGGTYLLTEDMVADESALRVSAANVTLDLGGHTVVYDDQHMGAIAGDTWDYINTSSIGVRAMDADGFRLLNGTVKQGAGADSAEGSSVGFNPVCTHSCTGMEIAGVRIEYNGPQQCGIYNHEGGDGSEFHHNIILDTATEMVNRHGAGCRAIIMYGSGSYSNVETYNNLILRTRQSGVGGNDVHDNEIYMDSWATNSFGIRTEVGGEAYANKVFGTGYHVVAFGWTSNLTYHHNFVHLEGQPPDGRFTEFGDQISLNGFRLTQYGGSTNNYLNNLYHDNVVIVTAVGSSECRGVQFFSDPYVVNLIFRDSILKSLVRDDLAYQAACVVTQGNASRTENHLPIYYLDNTFISNICNIRFGDYYGTGSNHRFHDCTLVRVGDDPDYTTFRWDSYYACKYHVVRDAAFEGGASLSSIYFGSGDHSMTVEWTLTVETDANADVTIRDADSQIVFTGNAGPAGSISTPLAQYLAAGSGNTYYTPHGVTVAKDGHSNTEPVTVDATKTVQIYVGGFPLTVTNGSGSGSYESGTVVPISADSPASGKLFARWIGDTSCVADTWAADTTVTMPAAAVSVTATYAWGHTLTVNSGTGDGLYLSAAVVDIQADAAPSGKEFDQWTGDTSQVANVNAEATTFTMPTYDCEATATYRPTLPGDCSGDGFVGQADLDMVLGKWGWTVDPADPADIDNDGFIGQSDLDIVLDNWGEAYP